MAPIEPTDDAYTPQADPTALTPPPGDPHNPREPLDWEWTYRRGGTGSGTGGGTQHHMIDPKRGALVLGGGWGSTSTEANHLRRVNFNYAFPDLAALIVLRPGFEDFQLREVVIEVGVGDDLVYESGQSLTRRTVSWPDGQVAAASLSDTVLLPEHVSYLGVIVDFIGTHRSALDSAVPVPFAPILFAEIALRIIRFRTPPHADIDPIVRPST